MVLKQSNEIILKGLPISKGIAMGKPFFFIPTIQKVPEFTINENQIEKEIERFRFAVEQSKEDIEELQVHLKKTEAPEIVSILEAHLEMLQDPLMTTQIEDEIRQSKKNTETVFQRAVDEYKDHFNGMKDPYFKERARDIEDISKRVLTHLCQPKVKSEPQTIPSNSIILTEELVPSDTAFAIASDASAFITTLGGPTSHAAIIARAKGIPYVANIDVLTLRNPSVDFIIVDGTNGCVILNPTQKTKEKYELLQSGHHEHYENLKKESHLDSETIDGYPVQILGNLEPLNDIDSLIEQGASGVGLFRSEYLFFLKKTFPTEEEQYEIYRKILDRLPDQPVVIRVFDIGGDKKSFKPNFSIFKHEMNPVLGGRAIRFLLKHPDILESQLRALLRAAQHGDVHILLPMISDLSEIREVRKILNRVWFDLVKEKLAVRKKVPLGCMIEVPSSALMCDALAQESDFLSIGTNDLVQYILAVDRSNPNMNYLYSPAHPSILRLIRMIVHSSNRYGKPLILCGEMAADPQFIPILIGLGIRKFSVSARHVPEIKHVIRKVTLLDACQAAEKAFQCKSGEELEQFIHPEVGMD